MAFEVPEEILSLIRDASMGVAREMEIRVVSMVTAAYRRGWADGYLTAFEDDDKETNREVN